MRLLDQVSDRVKTEYNKVSLVITNSHKFCLVSETMAGTERRKEVTGVRRGKLTIGLRRRREKQTWRGFFMYMTGETRAGRNGICNSLEEQEWDMGTIRLQ